MWGKTFLDLFQTDFIFPPTNNSYAHWKDFHLFIFIIFSFLLKKIKEWIAWWNPTFMNVCTKTLFVVQIKIDFILFLGLNTSLVPMYISEIAPLNLRGGLGTVNQLAVTVGLALSQVLGIEQILGTDDGWPILLGLAVCPAVLQLLLLPLCPESPRYLLITKQWEEEARKGVWHLTNFLFLNKRSVN